MKKLSDKIALVTGGSRGIGAAITRKLAEDGAKVFFTYFNSGQKAESLAEEIRENGGDAFAISADSASAEQLQKAVALVVERFGRIDVLVNNAGIYKGKPFVEHTLQDYEEVMTVNVRAIFVASNAAVKYMPAGGRIITIGSNMADGTFGPQTTLYSMSKSALQGFTRGLAWDLGERKINVTLVQPGPIDTDMNPANTEFADFARSRMPLKEYGRGEDIAAMVAYLAGEEGRFITGTALTVDGGFNA